MDKQLIIAQRVQKAFQGVWFNLQQLKKSISQVERELDSAWLILQRLRSKLTVS